MTLIEDTRNKVGKHRNVAAYCEKNGVELVRQSSEEHPRILRAASASL